MNKISNEPYAIDSNAKTFFRHQMLFPYLISFASLRLLSHWRITSVIKIPKITAADNAPVSCQMFNSIALFTYISHPQTRYR